MDNEPRLTDKIALVLGGSRGIGAESLDRLAKALNVPMHQLFNGVEFQKDEANQ